MCNTHPPDTRLPTEEVRKAARPEVRPAEPSLHDIEADGFVGLWRKRGERRSINCDGVRERDIPERATTSLAFCP